MRSETTLVVTTLFPMLQEPLRHDILLERDR
jgi:hypothetical protein